LVDFARDNESIAVGERKYFAQTVSARAAIDIAAQAQVSLYDCPRILISESRHGAFGFLVAKRPLQKSFNLDLLHRSSNDDKIWRLFAGFYYFRKIQPSNKGTPSFAGAKLELAD